MKPSEVFTLAMNSPCLDITSEVADIPVKLLDSQFKVRISQQRTKSLGTNLNWHVRSLGVLETS
jgi:hypothetical protein